MDFFAPALEDLVDELPEWWATDEGSEWRIVLTAFADGVDELSIDVEGIYADQALSTARDDALRREWARLYGAEQEQAPFTTEVLRGYLQARAAEDGSLASFIATLLAILRNPTNDVGTPLQFPLDGSGLQLAPDGSGLGPLFEQTDELAAIRFPPDGSGLHLPVDGSGLRFPERGRIEVEVLFADYRIIVRVLEILAFDRPAFARACDRFRPADYLPVEILEVL